MEKIKKCIANLKVEGKLKVYQMTVLVMTLFLVLVALISTVVIRSNIEKITKVWSPSLEYLQDLETMTAKYRIKQYQQSCLQTAKLKKDGMIMMQQTLHGKNTGVLQMKFCS